jgi:TolB-like protein
MLLLLLALAGSPAPPAPAPAPAPEDTTATVRTVAVLDFDNDSGDSRYDAMGKGISAMMISDLVGVPTIQVVERAHMQDLLAEMKLQQTSYFDPSTAQRVGKMLGAEYVVVGSIVAMDPQVAIDTRVVQVGTGEVVKAAKVKGKEKQLFDLQQKLADELIDGLEIALSPEQREALRQRQLADQVGDVETTLEFSQALALFDQEDYVGASEKLVGVARKAPQSAVVKLVNEEAKRRAARAGKNKARRMLRGLIRKGIG